MNEEIYYGGSSPSPNVFCTELNTYQFQFIQRLLPPEYKLELVRSRPKKEPTLPSLSKRSSTISIIAEPPVIIKKPPVAKPEPSSTRITLEIPPPSLPTRQASYTAPVIQPQQVQPQPQPQPTPKLQIILPSQIIHEKPTQEVEKIERMAVPVREKSTSIMINPPATKKKPQAQVQPQSHFQAEPQTQISLPLPTTSSKQAGKPMPEEDKKKCYNILNSLKKHFFAGPFKNPVDPVALNIPDYLTIIKEPMDLSTVEKNLRNDKYSNVNQFGADVRKIWKNAMTYNADGSEIYRMTTEISNYFEKLFKDVEVVAPVIPPPNLQVKIKEPYDIDKHVKKVCKQINGLHRNGGKFTMIDFYAMKFENVKDLPLTTAEKKALYSNVHQLPIAYLKGVWDIINDEIPPEKKNKEVLEFDLETLSVRVTRKLERFVNYHTAQIRKSKNRRAKREKKKEVELATQKAVKTESGERKPAQLIDDASSVSSFITESEEGGEEELQ